MNLKSSVRHQLASARCYRRIGFPTLARIDLADTIFGGDKSCEAGELELIKIDTGVQLKFITHLFSGSKAQGPHPLRRDSLTE